MKRMRRWMAGVIAVAGGVVCGLLGPPREAAAQAYKYTRPDPYAALSFYEETYGTSAGNCGSCITGFKHIRTRTAAGRIAGPSGHPYDVTIELHYCTPSVYPTWTCGFTYCGFKAAVNQPYTCMPWDPIATWGQQVARSTAQCSSFCDVIVARFMNQPGWARGAPANTAITTTWAGTGTPPSQQVQDQDRCAIEANIESALASFAIGQSGSACSDCAVLYHPSMNAVCQSATSCGGTCQ